RLPGAKRPGQPREPLLRLLELGELDGADLLRGDSRDEALELGAEEKRLPHLLPRERAHAKAPIRLERDEPERGQSPQRLSYRRPRDGVVRRELLLAEHRPRRELAGDDRLLEQEGDLVGLGADALRMSAHGRRWYAGSVRNSTNSRESATSAKSSFASSAASTAASSSRTRASVNRPARTHDHTCAREISAVAASSIRLSIAAAPTPRSHASR